MPLDPKGAALGLHRFGLGPRPASIRAIASDPRGALLAELERTNVGQIVNADLPTSGAAEVGRVAEAILRLRRSLDKALRRAAAVVRESAPTASEHYQAQHG